MLHVEALDHIVLNVGEAERSLSWYCDVLGLEGVRVEAWRRGEAPFPSVRVSPDTIIDLIAGPRSGENMDHFCLVVAPEALTTVRESGQFEIVSDNPDARPFGARGEGQALKVRDPDGNTIELRAY